MVAGLALRKRRKHHDLGEHRQPRADHQDERHEDDGRKMPREHDGRGIDRGPEKSKHTEGDVVAMREVDEAHHPKMSAMPSAPSA